MNFIGREQDLDCLEENYQKDSGFVVIYGRRRVGKTELIKQFIKGKNALYYLSMEEKEQDSLVRWTNAIAEFTNQPEMINSNISRWEFIFKNFVDYKSNEKKVLVIDEFPYLVKANLAFSSVMQYIWDEQLKPRKNIMLILCGSHMSIMEKQVLLYNSPLYGRITSEIKLKPLRFSVIKKELAKRFSQTVEIFSITGGIPKYLELLEGKEITTEEIISKHILSNKSPLFNEPRYLLKEDISDTTKCFSILKTIANGEHRLGNIAKNMEMANSEVKFVISKLIELGYIEKQVPITENKPETSKRGLYFISDNFIKFWFKYLYPYKSYLELGQKDIPLENLRKTFESKFVALAYEDICKDILLELSMNKKIEFSPSLIGSYWSNERKAENIQIDISAVDTHNKKLFLGECKYHKKPVDADVFFDLQNKTNKSKELFLFFRGYQHVYGIFSKSGFTNRMVNTAKERSNLYLINEMDLESL